MGDIELSATEFTVSASEKVSTGEYENGEYFVSLKGDVEGVESLDADTHEELRRRLLAAQGELQKVVEQAGENRHSHPDFENWEDVEDVR